jgi:hypothetical protein
LGRVELAAAGVLAIVVILVAAVEGGEHRRGGERRAVRCPLKVDVAGAPGVETADAARCEPRLRHVRAAIGARARRA